MQAKELCQLKSNRLSSTIGGQIIYDVTSVKQNKVNEIFLD